MQIHCIWPSCYAPGSATISAVRSGSLMGATELAVEDQADGGEALAVAVNRRPRWVAGCGFCARPGAARPVRWTSRGSRRWRRGCRSAAGSAARPRRRSTGDRVRPGRGTAGAECAASGGRGLAGNGRLAMSGAANADVLVTIEGPRASWPAGLATASPTSRRPGRRSPPRARLQAPLTALIARRQRAARLAADAGRIARGHAASAAAGPRRRYALSGLYRLFAGAGRGWLRPLMGRTSGA